MPDTPPPVTRHWGADAPVPPGRGQRRALLAVLVSLVVVTGATVGVLSWLAPPRSPAALPVWVTTEPGAAGAVPWAAQDRAALADGDLLGRPLDGGANPNRDQLRLRFRALATAPRSTPLVIALTAPAAVDAAGGVYLLPAELPGDNPRNRLPLAELLGYVAACPARDKLLVLNLTPPPDDATFAPPPGDLSAAVFRALDAAPDANRLCLVACGPGEVPLASPDLGRSVFGYYLEAGLRGAADGWGPRGDRDGRVSVTELAAFVRGRVSRWAAANLRADQTPVLVGTAADFTVRSFPLSQAGSSPTGEDAAPPAPYPDWLKAGWERHDRWQADGRTAAAPRAAQLLRVALLAAERDLLAGRPTADVQRDLDGRLASLDQLAAALAAVSAPDPLPTLAATFPGYALPDPALLDALDRAALQADALPPPAAAKPGAPPAPAAPAAPTDYDKLAKEKPHRELALAAFRQLTADPSPSAARVRRLAQMLAAQEPTPKFAETLLIQRLNELAGPAAIVPWSPERAAFALQTAAQLEDVAARPEAVAWAKPALDAAYRHRADAEAVLFAPGFASPAEATRRLRRAADTVAALKAAADQLRTALAARDEAAAWLAGLTPAADANLFAFADATRLADAAGLLADSLAPPAKPADAAGLADLARTWRDREAAVRTALAPVVAPFRAAAIARLRAAAESGTTATTLAHLDAVLHTPSVPAADRAALWNLRAAVTRRLNADAVRKDATDDESLRRGLERPPPVNPFEVSGIAADPEWATRRAAWTPALLRVGGLAADAAATAAELTRLAADAPAFAARLKRVWLEDVPAKLAKASAPAAARLARVAPVVPGTAALDQPDRNPTAQLRRDHARRLWAWQAARFGYEARDPLNPRADGSDRLFASLAARACAAVAGPPDAPYLEVTPGQAPVLTAEKETADLRVDVRLIGPAAGPVAVALLTPDDEWVRAATAGETKLGPIRERAVTFGVAAGPRPFAHPELRGVLVEATAGGRTYHRRVPVSLDALVNRLDLHVRTGPADPPRPAGSIALRPLGTAQPFQLLLGNPTPKPRAVVARLVGLDRATAPVTVEPGKFAPLVFPAPAAPAVPPAAPPPGQPASAEPPFTPLAGPLVVELIDPADATKILQRFTVPVRVLDPAQYLKVDEVTFRPAGTRPNRLAVRVTPEAPPAGPPVQVKVTLPPARNPDVAQVRDATLSGPLPADGRPLTLYAEDVAFTMPAGSRMVVTVGADTVDRAFTFVGTAPGSGAAVRLAPVTAPIIRVGRPAGEWFALPATPLPVPLEVDNAPDGAKVELRIGTLKTDPATGVPAFVTDAEMVVDPARERGRGLRFDPKGETLFLRGTLKDPTPELPVGLLAGRRTVEARLVTAGGDLLADTTAEVIFDGTPPTNVQFLDLPPRAGRGQPLPVRATCDPTISGVKEVWFFVGKPADGKLPAAPPPVPGKLIDPKANVWAAVIQPGTGDRATVGVEFVTRSGLRKIETADVELADPAELAKPKPGRIVGTLTESNIAQGDREVFLYDEKRAPLAKTTTKKDGTYEFAAVPPGRYSLYAQHVETNRDALVDVVVTAGTATKQDLALYLKATP